MPGIFYGGQEGLGKNQEEDANEKELDIFKGETDDPHDTVVRKKENNQDPNSWDDDED